MIDQLIESYRAPEEEFEIVLPKGESFRFRAITSYDELIALKRDGAKFVRMCHSDRCPKEWASMMPTNDEVLVSVFVLNKTAVNPQLTQSDLLKLSHKVGYVFNLLVENWEQNQTAKQVLREADAIEELKND